MSNLGLIIYLLSRALPRINNDEASKFWVSVGDFSKRIPLEKIDKILNKFLEKILRRTRVGILKVDNLVSSYLGKVKEGNKEDKDDQPTLFDRK